MLDFPSDFTHSHHIPMRENKYDFYFTNERVPPKQNDFSEESDWNTPYWSKSVLFPIPSGVVPADSNQSMMGSMNPKIPGVLGPVSELHLKSLGLLPSPWPAPILAFSGSATFPHPNAQHR